MLILHSTPLALKTSVRKSIGSQYLVLQGNRSINIIFYINIIKCKYYFMIDYRMNTMESFITLSRYFKFSSGKNIPVTFLSVLTNTNYR